MRGVGVRSSIAAVAWSFIGAQAATGQCGGFCIYEVGTPQMGSSYAGAGATAQDAGWLPVVGQLG